MRTPDLPGLALDFTVANYLPMAHGVAYPKVLAAMKIAACEQATCCTEAFQAVLTDAQKARAKANAPQ